ncbi:MAG: hypothetical protein NTW64_06450 [Candidatus Omnitrophica bacterium]|nr:hypothetical protein [Candidatus Omnitrophota bacterium]
MSILLYLKSLIVKILNKLFGRTRIFILILGWFLLITGIWMLLQPEKAKKSLAGQGFGIFKGYLLLLALFAGMLLLSLSTKVSGVLSLLILVAGFFILIRAYFLLKKRAAHKISSWVEKVPIKYLKIYAAIQTIIGALMLLLHRRIWY